MGARLVGRRSRGKSSRTLYLESERRAPLLPARARTRLLRHSRILRAVCLPMRVAAGSRPNRRALTRKGRIAPRAAGGLENRKKSQIGRRERLASGPLEPLLQGGQQALVGALRLTAHESGQQAWTIDRDGLCHTRACGLRLEPVAGVQNETRSAPHGDLDLAIAHQCKHPFDSVAKGNHAGEEELLHGFKASGRPALRVAAPPGLVKLDEERLEPQESAWLGEVCEYRCGLRADPGTLLEAEPHRNVRVS